MNEQFILAFISKKRPKSIPCVACGTVVEEYLMPQSDNPEVVALSLYG